MNRCREVPGVDLFDCRIALMLLQDEHAAVGPLIQECAVQSIAGECAAALHVIMGQMRDAKWQMLFHSACRGGVRFVRSNAFQRERDKTYQPLSSMATSPAEAVLWLI